MINYESLIKHLKVVDNLPFGLLSQQASPVGGLLSTQFPERLACLFSPEHGWFGFAGPGEKTDDSEHPFWHVPVYSLYGETRQPTPEMLQGLGRVVIDLQDIGVRCYTYLATLKLMLEACAEANLPVTVLDRPIPLGGVLDGPRRKIEFASFVAPLDIPFCHGMTPGECATYIVRREELEVDLTVIKMKDWSHSDRTPWPNFVPPSPAIRSWDSAVLYPATVFTEAYPALDCDRSGPLAFRVLGAPWLDVVQLMEDLAEVLPSCGISIRPIRYRPAGGNYQGQILNGLLLSIENPEAFYPVTAGVIIYAAIRHRHKADFFKDGRDEWLDKLTGSSEVREAYQNDSLSELFQAWIEGQDEYLQHRVNLYK